MKKYIITLLLIFSSLCFGFNNQNILGDWKLQSDQSFSCEMTFLPDGNYISKVTIRLGRISSSSTGTGKYKIEGNRITFFIKDRIDKFLILKLDADKMILFSFKDKITSVYYR